MRRLTSRRSSAGFSLVEIMVGIVVGLFVLVGLSSVYVNSCAAGAPPRRPTTQPGAARADGHMVNDIRRAGYWSLTAAGVNNAFDAATTQPTLRPLHPL